MKKNIAVFDLDGTLTYADTSLFFAIHCFGFWTVLLKGLKLIPYFIKYNFGQISRKEIKEQFLKCYFTGKSSDFFKEKGLDFFKSRSWFFRKKTIDNLLEHKNRGDKIILVSANIYPLVVNLKDVFPIDHVIATTVEFDHRGHMTGRIIGDNCWGAEKLKRLLEVIDRPQVILTAYGDSSGDKDLLESADVSHWI